MLHVLPAASFWFLRKANKMDAILDLAEVISKFDKDLTLKEEQKSILKAVYDSEDVLASLPTGYGKSLTFQLTTRLLRQRDHTTNGFTLVISPLNAIQLDQMATLKQKGIAACRLDMVGSCTSNMHEVNQMNQ